MIAYGFYYNFIFHCYCVIFEFFWLLETIQMLHVWKTKQMTCDGRKLSDMKADSSQNRIVDKNR